MRAVVGAVALCGSVVLSAQAPSFKLSVDAVRVDALAMQGDRPVGGLHARDFELRDSGVVQRIEAVSYEDEPLRVALVLDVSLSVNGERLAHLRDAARAVVDLLASQDTATVLALSAEVDAACAWTGDHARLASSLDRRVGQGGTALYDATYAALLTRDTKPGRTLVLVFSDGADTASWLSGGAVLDAARRSDAVVYAVGVATSGPPEAPGFRVDVSSGTQLLPSSAATAPSLTESFLPALAKETGGKYTNVESTARLRSVFANVLAEFRTRYVLTYTPEGVPAHGWHPIDVKVRSAGAKVTARRGYLR